MNVPRFEIHTYIAYLFTVISIILGILVTRRSKNKENESPEGIKKSSTAHYSDTGMKIKINNESQIKKSSTARYSDTEMKIKIKNESPEGIQKSSKSHYSDTGLKIKINNENQTRIASVHDGKKQPFQCNTCDAYFSKKSKLASHIFDAVCFNQRNEQDLPKNSSSSTRYTDSGIKIKIKNAHC